MTLLSNSCVKMLFVGEHVELFEVMNDSCHSFLPLNGDPFVYFRDNEIAEGNGEYRGCIVIHQLLFQ